MTNITELHYHGSQVFLTVLIRGAFLDKKGSQMEKLKKL